METDRNNSLNNVLCNILFKKNGFCCLCLETISAEGGTPSPVHIHDAVILDNSNNTKINDIVSCVLGSEFLDSISTQVICDQCIRSAINSYRFIDKCKKNKLNLDNAIDCLAASVEETILNVYDYKTLYLSVNTNAKISQQYYDTSSTRTRAGAFKKFKSLTRPTLTFKPKLEKKSKSKQRDICHVVSAEKDFKKFECTICSLISSSLAALENHFCTYHSSELFDELQEEPFYGEGPELNLKKDNICDVVTAEDGSRKYKCKVCSIVCSSTFTLQRHFSSFHNSHPLAKQDTLSTRTRSEAFKKFKSLTRPKPTFKPILEKKTNLGLREISSRTSLKQHDTCNVSAEDGLKIIRTSQLFEELGEDLFHEKDPKFNLENDYICDLVTAEDGSRKYKCKVCSVVCSRTSTLQRHFRSLHSSHPLPKQCVDPSIEDRPEAYLKKDKMCTVVNDKDGSKKYECKICHFISSQLSGMRRHYRCFHLSQQHRARAQVCFQCGKLFASSSYLRFHEKHTHNVRLTCPKCKKVYRHKKNFIDHISQDTCEHASRKLSFQCDTCLAMFSRRHSLVQHIKVNHDPHRDLPTCAWCGKKFISQSALKGHIVKHTQEKKFRCELCDGVFVTKASLLYHTRTHTGETPYQCKFCELSFLSASRRSEHVRRKHMEPSLECGLCPKKFRNHTCKKRHRKRHSNPSSSLYIPTH